MVLGISSHASLQLDGAGRPNLEASQRMGILVSTESCEVAEEFRPPTHHVKGSGGSGAIWR
jgi:hypothetical protein